MKALNLPSIALATAVAALLSFTAPAAADPLAGPGLSFVYDPSHGVEAGVLSVHSLGDVVSLYDSALSRLIHWTPRTQGGRLLGMLGRVAQSAFVDMPVAALETVLIHEVFGHGSRAQAWGAQPSYSFHVPAPYNWIFGDHSTNSAETSDAGTDQRERNITMIAGGIEAQLYSAYRMELDAMRLDGRMPHARQLLYITAKGTYLGSFLNPLNPAAIAGDDVNNYVRELANRFNRYRPAELAAVADRLRQAYLANYLDPTLWMSVYGYLVNYLVLGRADSSLPMLRLGPVSLYASTRFALSPFGAEHYLDLFARFRGRTFTVYGRAVSSGLATAWGAGMKALDLVRLGGLGLGLEVDAWEQPEMLLDPSELYVFERPQRGGVSLAVDLDWKIAWRVGLTGKLGWKTDGWLMGEPLGQGPYGWIGLAFYADADGALFKWRS